MTHLHTIQSSDALPDTQSRLFIQRSLSHCVKLMFSAVEIQMIRDPLTDNYMHDAISR